MKKTLLAILSVLVLFSGFTSCSKHKTYAERLADEKKAMDRYIKSHGINVISYDEFIAKNKETDTSKNEYVQLQTGLYLQIVNKGSVNEADTFKNRDEITVRFLEYNILDKTYTGASNIVESDVDAFIFSDDGSRLKGSFLAGSSMREAYSSPVVPQGWLIPLKYVRKDATIKLIVSSKLGHVVAGSNVLPFAYDIQKLSLSKH